MNKHRGNLGFLLLVLLSVVILAVVLTPAGSASDMKYSEMVQYFQTEEVTAFTLDLGTGEMEMTVKGEEQPLQYKLGSLTLFLEDGHQYIAQYNQAHPEAPMDYDYVPAKETSWFLSMLPSLLMRVAMGALFFVMMRQSAGGVKFMGGMGKARVQDPNESGER